MKISHGGVEKHGLKGEAAMEWIESEKGTGLVLKLSFKSLISNVIMGNWEKLESLKLEFIC